MLKGRETGRTVNGGQYDVLGRRTQLTVPNQTPVTYSYDVASRLTSITQGSNVVQLAYDAASRRTSLTLPNGVSTQYAYDAASQLTALTYMLGAATLGDLQYTYDAAGNRIQIGGAWARSGVPLALTSATYNANNQQLMFGGQNLAYDLNGNLTSDGTNTYTWDARNRLAAIGGPVPANLVYDPVGRRSRKTINGVITDFIYNGVNPVQEQSGPTLTNLLTSLGVDEYFSRGDVISTACFLADPLGSTIAVTDGTAAVSSSYTYEPFGVVSGASTNPLQYTGRENDGTGLYHYRARYYHPRLQRFISEDPIGFAGGDVNLYGYVLNRPTLFRDPHGLDGAKDNCSYAAVGCGEPPLAGRKPPPTPNTSGAPSNSGEVIPLPPNPGPKPWHHWPEPKMPWDSPANVRDIRPPSAPPGAFPPSWHVLPGLIVPDWTSIQRYLDSLKGPQGGEV